MTKTDINDRLAVIQSEMEAIIANAQSESRMLNDDESARIESLKAEKAQLREQLNQQQNSQKMEKKNFSLLESIRNVVNGRSNDDFAEYLAATREMGNRAGVSCVGQIQVATRSIDGILTAGHEYTASTYNGGKEMVATEVLPLEQAIYNNTILKNAGARFYNGLVGDVKIPVIGKSTCFWEGENDQTESGTPTMSKLLLQPKRVACFVDLSKQLLNQTSGDVERQVKESIALAVAEKLESSILSDGTTPHNGMMYGASGVAAASVTYATCTDLEASIMGSNFNPTFVVNPSSANLLKTKSRLTYGNVPVFADGKIDGYNTFITNNASVTDANPLICADFSQLAIGTWGDMIDITVDTVTRAAYGEIRLVLNAYFDFGWLSSSAFAVKKITAA